MKLFLAFIALLFLVGGADARRCKSGKGRMVQRSGGQRAVVMQKSKTAACKGGKCAR